MNASIWQLGISSSFLLTASLVAPVALVNAAPAYQAVFRDTAAQTQTMLQLEGGRSTVIDFSPAQERIVFVNLADPSRVVYTANAQIQSGQATSLFLTPIHKLRFPGATTSDLTNLQVQTVDGSGGRRMYTFNLLHVRNARFAGIVVTPYQQKEKRSRRVAARTSPALNIDAIERGLAIALERNYTAPNDPVVTKVKQVVLQVRQGVSVSHAARNAQVPMPVLRSLAELGSAPTTSLPSAVPNSVPVPSPGGVR